MNHSIQCIVEALQPYDLLLTVKDQCLQFLYVKAVKDQIHRVLVFSIMFLEVADHTVQRMLLFKLRLVTVVLMVKDFRVVLCPEYVTVPFLTM